MAKTTKVYSRRRGVKETLEIEEPLTRGQRFKKWLKRLIPFAKKNWLSLITIAIVLVGFGFLGAKYMQTKNQLQQLTNPKTAGKTEIQIIEEHIDRTVDLPDEEPTLATVNDANKLKNQSFFKNSQNGDKLLIYTKSQRALLFRPVLNKVIEYSNVNLQGNSQQQQSQSQTQQGSTNTPTTSPNPTAQPTQ